MKESSSKFSEFALIRKRLHVLLDVLKTLPACDNLAAVHEGTNGISVRQILSELQNTISQDRFRVALIGEFSAGKSSLLNVLLDRIDLEGKRTDGFLPTAISPTTPVLTSLIQSESPYVRLTLDDSSTMEVEVDELKSYLCAPDLRSKWSWQTDGESKEILCDRIREVQIGLDCQLLKHGVELLDTPGLGSIYARHGEITKTCVAGVDAALFLIATDPPMGEREMTFLQYISGYMDRLLFVQTKIDIKEEIEDGELGWKLRSNNYVSRISEVLGHGPHKILPVSAVLAARAVRTNDSALAVASGISELKFALEDLLVTVRGTERTTNWTKRVGLMIEIMISNVGSELRQVKSHMESMELVVATEGEYLQWEAAIPLFQQHMRELRHRTRSRIGDARSEVLQAVRVEVMPSLTGLSAEKLHSNAEKGLRLERQLVETVQRQTAQILDPLVTDACADAEMAATQTLGESLPKSFRELQGTVDLRLVLQSANLSLSLTALINTSSEIRTRRPQGFWENVQSFFGKLFEESVTTHKLNLDYFEAMVGKAVQDSVQEIASNLETHIQAVATAVIHEMKRLEGAARERDSRAERIREQGLEEVKQRESELLSELKTLETFRAELASIVSLSEDRSH